MAIEFARLTAKFTADTSELSRAEGVVKSSLKSIAAEQDKLAASQSRLTALQGGASAANARLTASLRSVTPAIREQILATEQQAQKIITLRKAMANFGQSLTSAGQKLSVGLTLPLVALGAKAATIAADFEQSQNVFQAAASASAAEMEQMRAKARELGSDMTLPGTSAVSAAKAMTELSKAGLSVNNTLTASKGVLQLAAAGMLDDARAAEIVANTLNTFSMAGNQAGRVADLLAAAANASSASVQDLSLSLQYAGTVYAQAGISIEDLTASMALLANVGIKGEKAGTVLRTMIVSLQKPSREAGLALKSLGVTPFNKATGELKPYKQLIDEMQKGLLKATQQQRAWALTTIFGKEAQAGATAVLLGGVKAHEKYLASVTKNGAAADLAAAQNKGLKGAIDAIKSAFETASEAAITPMIGDLTALAKRAGELVNSFSTLSPEVRKTVVVIAALTAAVGPLLIVLGQMASGLVAVKAALALVGIGVTGFVALLAGAVIAVGAFVLAYVTNFHGLRDQLLDGWLEIEKIFANAGDRIKSTMQGTWNEILINSGDSFEELQARASANWNKLVTNFQRGRQLIRQAVGLEQPAADTGMIKDIRGGFAQHLGAGPKTTAPSIRTTGPPVLPSTVGGPTTRSGSGNAGLAKVMADREKGRAAKLTPSQQQALQFSNELAGATERLKVLMAGEGNIAGQVASRYELLSASKRADLITTLSQIAAKEKGIAAETKFKNALDETRAKIRDTQRGTKEATLTEQFGMFISKERIGVLDKEKARLVTLDKAQKDKAKSDKDEADALETVRNALRGKEADTKKLLAVDDKNRVSLELLRKSYDDLSPAIQKVIDLYLGQEQRQATINQTRKAEIFTLNKQMDALANLEGAYDAQIVKQAELNGATDAEVFSLKKLIAELDLTDQATQDLLIDTLALIDANERKAASNKAAAKAAKEATDVDEKLHNEQVRIKGQIEEMLGLVPKQSQAIRLLKDQSASFTEAQKAQLESITKDQKKLSELQKVLPVLKQLADGTADVFENAFNDLFQNGFKNFFSNVFSGFQQLLQKMAAEYLASQLRNLLMGLIQKGIGAAFGAAGGGGGGSTPGGWHAPMALPELSSGGGNGPWAEGLGDLFAPRQTPSDLFNRSAPDYGGAPSVVVQMTVHSPDLGSFKNSQDQIAEELGRKMQIATRRNRG